MVDLKTDGGESLVQSNLSKPLAEVVDIYHKCNLGETLTQDQFNKLLQASINNTFPENYRIRMATCFVEHAHKFPDSIGDTIQTLLALICEQNSRHTRDTAVRSIPWLCRTIEEETRSRVICELSDVLLQLCMSSSGESLEQTASKALNELLVLDSKAVISKLFVWIGDNRVDEIDPEVCLQEKSFASQKLKEILTSKSECLSPESIQELGDILKEQIRMCSCIDDIHSVFKIVRSMKKFDDRQCARVLTAFLGEGLTPETATTSSLQEQRIPSLHIGATLVLCAPSAAKRIDSQLASKFIQNVFTLKFRRNLVLLQCAATMSEIASDECVAAILPSTIDALVEVLQNDTVRGLPKNLSELEALLSIFSQCARKVPTLLLKLIEQKNVEGTSTNKLFQSLASLKISLNQVITDELMYASKKFALTNEDDTTGMNQAPICISSILSYVNALTNSPMPKIPNPLPALSWESHFHTRKETSVPNKKNRQ